jgi:hypothetical protein
MDFFIASEKDDASFYGQVIVTRLSSFMEYYGYSDIKPEDFFRKHIFLDCEFSFVNDWGISIMKEMRIIVTMII